MNLNKNIHVVDEHGDPVRNTDGSIELQKNWQKNAVDPQGRSLNKRIHEMVGNTPVLDDNGYLKVTRRQSSVTGGSIEKGVIGSFVDKHKENGYAYYTASDNGGRVQQMIDQGWEPVTDKNGTAKVNVGQAREPNTEGVLFRKPIEWFEQDREEKRRARVVDLKQKTSPREEEGQYDATHTSPSPLR